MESSLFFYWIENKNDRKVALVLVSVCHT